MTGDGRVVQTFVISSGRWGRGACERSQRRPDRRWLHHALPAREPVQRRSSAARRSPVSRDPFFFDLGGFIQFKGELLKGTTALGAPGGRRRHLASAASPHRYVRRNNVARSAAWIPNRFLVAPAPTSASGDDLPSRRDRLHAGRPNGPAGDQHRVSMASTPRIEPPLNNAEKEAFNRLNPSADRAVTSDNVAASLGAIDNVLVVNAAPHYTAGQITAITYAPARRPDVPGRKTPAGSSTAARGRRRDQRGVGLLTDGNVTSDGVDANDSTFRGTSFRTWPVPTERPDRRRDRVRVRPVRPPSVQLDHASAHARDLDMTGSRRSLDRTSRRVGRARCSSGPSD